MQNSLTTQPLYRQVRDEIIASLRVGKYVVDVALPSEQRLAIEYGVSQGTVRKAIDDLVAQNILYRHQGRGTFIRRHTESQSLFRFFNLVRPDGSRPLPSSINLSLTTQATPLEVAIQLGLDEKQLVVCLHRIRIIDEVPAIYETIYLDHQWFHDYEGIELPNTLYQLYADHYGINVTRAEEQISVTIPSAAQAELLKLSSPTAVLQITRVAYGIDDQPVEYRISLCRSDLLRYQSALG
jgi:Transcriptional regulators